MKKKLIGLIGSLASIVIVISIPLLIMSTTVTAYVGNEELYKNCFNKYQISKTTGISNIQLEEVARKMVDYLVGSSQSPQVTVTRNGGQFQLYNEKELLHLEDVRDIIQLFKVAQVVSIILFVILAVFIYLNAGVKHLLRLIKIGSIVTATFTVLIVAWALIDFNSLFLIFHFISFSNDLWILDPTRDYLIMIFPEGFFNDAALMIILTILLCAGIIWLAAYLTRKGLPGKANAD